MACASHLLHKRNSFIYSTRLILVKISFPNHFLTLFSYKKLTLLPQRGFVLKKIPFFTILISLCCSLSFAQETLTVYKKTATGIDENTPAGSLVFTDQIRELPPPMDSVKKVIVVKDSIEVKDRKGNVKKDKKGRPKYKVKKRRVTIWEKVEPKEPPRFVPIQCKLGEVWVKRADLARFQQASIDLSGEYASSTGSVFGLSSCAAFTIEMSPPKRWNVTWIFGALWRDLIFDFLPG